MRWLLAVLGAVWVALGVAMERPVQCRCAQEWCRRDAGLDVKPCPKHGPV